MAVRAAAGPPEALAGTLRRTVAALDPDLALARVGTMSLFARDSIARERVSTLLMSVLALSALALAALGIYGVMSYSVAERRQEWACASRLARRRAICIGSCSREASA